MRRKSLTRLLCLVVTVALAATAWADDPVYHWEVASGNWSVAENWDPDRDNPDPSDLMYVDRDGGATCTFDVDEEDDETVDAVYVEAGNTILHGTGCGLTIDGTSVGKKGLYIGCGDGTGTYSISGGTLSVENVNGNAEVVLGYVGGVTGSRGLFNQSGGECSFDVLRVSCFYPPGEDPCVYTLSGGTLTVIREWVGRVGDGELIQSGGTHRVYGNLAVGGASGHGYLSISGSASVTVTVGGESEYGGNLYAGEYGVGEILHEGSATVTVVQNQDDEGGSLIVGGPGGHGVYTLNGADADLSVETEIQIGKYVYAGRFEWFSGEDQIDTPEMALDSMGTLAMGFDFDVDELLDASVFENDDYTAELTGLADAALEITNNATATHDSNTNLTVGQLNIGSSDVPADGDGTYNIAGTFTGNAIEAGGLFIALKDDGTLNIGDASTSTDAAIEVTSRLTTAGKTASVYFGPDSNFAVTAPGGGSSSCTMTLTNAGAKFDFEVDVSDAANVDGLALLKLVFDGENSGSYSKTLEVAGAEVAEGLPTGGDFDDDNFVIEELVVGKASAGDTYGPVTLALVDSVDNQDDGDNDEAVYVNTLTITKGGTFSGSSVNSYQLFYRNGGNPKRFYMGDANLDGKVDGADYTVWADNYDPEATGKVWSQADFNGDRKVDGADYGIWADNYGKGT